MALALFTLQNIPDHHSGIHTVQGCGHLVGLQSHIGQHGHAAESGIGLIQLLWIVAFAFCIQNPLTHLPGGRFPMGDGIAVEVQKLPEGQGQHLDLHIPPGEVGGKLRGQQVGIGAGNVDVAVQIHPEGIDRIFPAADALYLVKEQVHPLARDGAVHDMGVKIPCGHVGKAHGFKVDLDDLFFQNTAGPKLVGHQLHQTGFSAPADAGDDLDHLGIPERLELFQIEWPVPKVCVKHMRSHLSE